MSRVEDYYNHPHVAAQLYPSYEEAVIASGPALPAFSRSSLGLAAWLPEQRTVMIAGALFLLGAALVGTSIYLRRS